MKFSAITLIVLCFLCVADAYSQVPDYPTNIEWNRAGAVSDFPDSSEVDNIFYVSPASPNSDWQNIMTAIDSAGAAYGTSLVLLKEGTYTLNRPLIFEAGSHDNVYLKGAGPDHLMHAGPRTTLKFDFSDPNNFNVQVYGGMNAGIAFKGGRDVLLGTIAEYDSDSNQVTIAASQSTPEELDFVRIRSNRGSCKDHPCMGQINRVSKVISSSPLVLELDHDFSLTWDQQEEYGGLTLDVHTVDALQNVGVSSLGIETVGYQPAPLPDHFVCRDEPNAGHSPQGHHILAFRVYNAKVKDISSYKPIASHLYFLESYRNTVSGSFFNDVAYSHGCNGGHGYGVNLWRKNTLNLIEDNIFRHLRRAMAVSRGAHKNVIGYNYSREVWRQTGNPEQGGDMGSRNWNASGNLVEGNRVSRIWNDTYHEKRFTAYNDAYVRNFTTLNSLLNEGGIDIYFIGNQGELSGYSNSSSIKTDLYGFKDSTPSSHNSSFSGSSNSDIILNLSSLYHNEVPAFISQEDSWNQTYTWPLIGPRLSKADHQLTQDIPARGRYCQAYNDYPDSAYHCSGAPIGEPTESDGE